MPANYDQLAEEEKLEWTIRRANMRNGGRGRYSSLTCPDEECKDLAGNWNKWVPSRLNEKERACLEELKAKCALHPSTDWHKDNHYIRYLQSYKYHVQNAYESIRRVEKMRYELGCDSLTAEQVNGYGIKSYCEMGVEKNGRPVLFTKASAWEMQKTTADMHMHACIFYSDRTLSKMPAHLDNYVMIFDFEGFSLS